MTLTSLTTRKDNANLMKQTLTESPSF
uniref:Uncharacterized protein n=1 Tax=Amphimedon queenslandica TaxID=400682 RepID=A0A1X7V6N9_AMPQE